jgi:inhibitor of cysteine peptidase
MQQFKEEADESEVQVSLGEVFEICLNENPTTGFRWKLESQGQPACILVKEHLSRHNNAPGSPSIHHWNFKAVARGTSTIHLAYGRRWQKDPPARDFRLTIRTGE